MQLLNERSNRNESLRLISTEISTHALNFGWDTGVGNGKGLEVTTVASHGVIYWKFYALSSAKIGFFYSTAL